MSFDLLGADSAPSLDDVRLDKGALKRGMKGQSVSDLQRLLGLSGKDIDGDFGNITEKAVETFQRAHNLKVDGVAGRNTVAALDEQLMSGGPIQTIDFSDSPETVTAKKPPVGVTSTTSIANPSVKSSTTAATTVPSAHEIKAKTESSPITTYATYGAIGAGALAIAYAAFGKKLGLK